MKKINIFLFAIMVFFSISVFSQIPSISSQNTDVLNNFDLIEVDYWIVSQYKNNSVRVSDGLIETSVDNSETWSKSLIFTDADKISQGVVLKNGNILLITNENKIYLTNIELSSITEKTVFESDGVTPYTIHTPMNASFAGSYFYTLVTNNHYDNTDLYVWGNYANVQTDASPVNIYFTDDFGETIKISYEFGQNENFRDNGTASGGNTGTLLGDAGNSLKCRHVHSVFYNQFNDKWYCATGDSEIAFNGSVDEIHWLEGEYNDGLDTWTWNEIDFGFEITRASQLKIVEGIIHNDFIYYGTDITDASNPNDFNGIWKAPTSTLDDISTHTKVFSFPIYTEANFGFKIDFDYGNIVYINNENPISSSADKLFYVDDFGSGTPVLNSFLSDNLIDLQYKNDKGYFLIQTEAFSTLHGRCILIKPNYKINEE